MEELSEEQIEEFKEAFSLFDHDNKGHIYTKELGTVLRSLGINTNDDEKNEFITKYDISGEGKIHFKDFLEIIIQKIAETKPEVEILEAFKLFTNEKSNYIKMSTFKEVLNTYCKGIDNDEIESISNFLMSGEDSDYLKIEDARDKIKNIINKDLD